MSITGQATLACLGLLACAAHLGAAAEESAAIAAAETPLDRYVATADEAVKLLREHHERWLKQR